MRAAAPGFAQIADCVCLYTLLQPQARGAQAARQRVATLAVAGDSVEREAGQPAMVAFAVRVGNKSILDKVRRPLLLPPLVLLC